MDAVLARIQFTTSMEEAVKDAQFIQESGPERLPIKHSMLAEIEKYAPVDAIVATSASGLPLGQITEHAVHPERCVGGHPYNPPHLIPLVEITKTEKTDEANVELAKEFYESLGKEAIVLKKDCPGYICNRLQLAVFREMVDLVERGVCTVEEADKALTFGPAIRWAIFGHNMIMQLGNKDGLKGMMDMLAGGFNLCADIAAWDTINFNAQIVKLFDWGIACEEIHWSWSKADDLQILESDDCSCDWHKFMDHIGTFLSITHRILRNISLDIAQLQIVTGI